MLKSVKIQNPSLRVTSRADEVNIPMEANINHLFTDSQFGFRQINLILLWWKYIVNYILDTFGRKSSVAISFLDLSKA